MVTFGSAQLMAWVGLYLWPFLRILSLFMAAPLFSDKAIPMRVKLGLGIAFAVVLAPTLPAQPPLSADVAQIFSLALQQVSIGLLQGFAVRLTMAGVEMAGELIGLQMGFSFGGFFDAQGSGDSTAVGSWLGVIAMLMFLAMNGHLLMIDTLAESFRLFPVGGDILSMRDLQGVLTRGGEMFRLALQLALPFIAILLTVNLALGVMVRVAPQLNLMSVGMPATITVGFAALYVLLPYLERPVTQALEQGMLGLAR